MTRYNSFGIIAVLKLIRYILFDLWDTRTEYQKQKDKEKIEQLKQFRQKYPSLRITSRSISIDPKEIINSPEFKRDLNNCHKMFDRLNKK